MNNIGKFDQFVGIIPCMSAFGVMLEENSFNLKQYISNLRRFTVMEKIFHSDELDRSIKICNDKNAEYTQFGQIVLEEDSEDELQAIVSTLKQDKIISDAESDDAGCFTVQKHPQMQEFNFLDDALNFIKSYSEPSLEYLSDSERDQSLFAVMIEKMHFTMELSKILHDKNLIVDLNNKMLSMGFKHQNKLSIPLVGAIKGSPGSTAVYILSYFEPTQDNCDLQQARFQIKMMLNLLFENNTFKKSMRNVAYSGGIVDNCFVRKIVTFSKTQNMCVLYCIVFKNDLFLNESNDFLMDVKKNIEKKLKWNAVYNISEFVTLPLS